MSPICHADVIVPALVMVAPVMWLMLGAVIVIEALLSRFRIEVGKIWQQQYTHKEH
ncbi:hypothetical protein [Rickettsia amblyommatis]|uniref:hypothetical protein n=1 Tax=Rickettsia amblyommatis TaxID=33989 RepID=UPI0002DFF989|nr:hypothetical protein [Rickettsia amblyommatis]KJV98575.1 hypothetical protein RAMDARK_1929 [Rickettsia amblyommatis str. Darkwater]